MTKKQPDFILFLMPNAVYRVGVTADMDFTPPAQFPRFPGQSLKTAITPAVSALPKGASVLLFDSDLWCQTLALDNRQISGLSSTELQAAVAFEAEAFSGLSPQQAQLIFAAIPSTTAEHSAFRAMQVGHTELADIQDVVNAFGLRLHGISHPLFLLPPGEAETLSEDNIVTHLSHWPSLDAIPAVHPLAPEQSAQKYMLTALVAALVVALVCGLFHGIGMLRIERLKAKSGAGSLQNKLAGLQRDIQRTQNEISAFESQQRQLLEDQKILRTAQARLGTLLTAIAETAPDSLMIRDIQPHGFFGVTLFGLSVRPEDADNFFINLSYALPAEDWVVRPAKLTAHHILPNGGPWSFESHLLPVDSTGGTEVR